MTTELNNKIVTYIKGIRFWSAEKVASFLKLHKNKTSKVYKTLLEYANRRHLLDVMMKRVELVP